MHVADLLVAVAELEISTKQNVRTLHQRMSRVLKAIYGVHVEVLHNADKT